jgi:hypothetical protein
MKVKTRVFYCLVKSLDLQYTELQLCVLFYLSVASCRTAMALNTGLLGEVRDREGQDVAGG